MSLLPKKQGGTRTIATCPSIYRVLLATLSGLFAEWGAAMTEAAPFLDSAAPGNTAEGAAYLRAAVLEVHQTLGFHTVQILGDIQACFDSVSVHRLVAAAEIWELPALPTALSLQLHLAERALKVGGCFGTPMPHQGVRIMAGGASSTLCWAPLTARMSMPVQSACCHNCMSR